MIIMENMTFDVCESELDMDPIPRIVLPLKYFFFYINFVIEFALLWKCNMKNK